MSRANRPFLIVRADEGNVLLVTLGSSGAAPARHISGGRRYLHPHWYQRHLKCEMSQPTPATIGKVLVSELDVPYPRWDGKPPTALNTVDIYTPGRALAVDREMRSGVAQDIVDEIGDREGHGVWVMSDQPCSQFSIHCRTRATIGYHERKAVRNRSLMASEIDTSMAGLGATQQSPPSHSYPPCLSLRNDIRRSTPN